MLPFSLIRGGGGLGAGVAAVLALSGGLAVKMYNNTIEKRVVLEQQIEAFERVATLEEEVEKQRAQTMRDLLDDRIQMENVPTPISGEPIRVRDLEQFLAEEAR